MVTGTVAARAPGATAKDVPFAQTRGHLNSGERASLPAPSSRWVLAGAVAQRMGRAAARHTSSNHAEKSHRVAARHHDRNGVDALDPEALATARAGFKTKNAKHAEEVDAWDMLVFLNKAKLARNGGITRAALLLLGTTEASHWLSPADARPVRVAMFAYPDEGADPESDPSTESGTNTESEGGEE